MKAVVIKTKENTAAVLLKDGSLRYVENLGYSQGTILELPEEKEAALIPFEGTGSRKKGTLHFPYNLGSTAAAVFAVLTLSGAMVSYACPVATVPLSSNPAVSMGVNCYGRVVEINTSDREYESIINGINADFSGRDISSADEILSGAIEEAVRGIDTENKPVNTEGEKSLPETAPEDAAKEPSPAPSMERPQEGQERQDDPSGRDENTPRPPYEQETETETDRDSGNKGEEEPSPDKDDKNREKPEADHRPAPDRQDPSGEAAQKSDGSVPPDNGGTQQPEALPVPDGTVTLPDGTAVQPDGTVIFPDGTVVPPAGGVSYRQIRAI